MKKRTRNFADVIRSKLRSDPDLAKHVRKESFNADIAQKVYDLRVKAGLTQIELADRVGTQQSVISRIEDADYDGHSLKLLKRIADVLGAELRIEFSPIKKNCAVIVTVLTVNWSADKWTAGADIPVDAGYSTWSARATTGFDPLDALWHRSPSTIYS